MHGRSNMRPALYHLDIGIMANLSILWFFAFRFLVVVPSPIFHILMMSDSLTSECLSLNVKVLWEGTSWRRPSKTSSSRSVILVASGTLELAILTCDTSLISMKDRPCTMSRIPSSISVSWTFLRNVSTLISAIYANKSPSYSMCEPFGMRTEWGSQSCCYVRTICGKYSNCCCVSDEVPAQTIVPDI